MTNKKLYGTPSNYSGPEFLTKSEFVESSIENARKRRAQCGLFRRSSVEDRIVGCQIVGEIRNWNKLRAYANKIFEVNNNG